ncbi:MAG: serine hydrolase [Methanoregula sp.]|nr:serine hydrolase [Methanoregula sp.]
MKSTISSTLGMVSVLIAILCVLCLPAAASDQTVIPNSTSIALSGNGPSDPAEVEAFLDSVMPANLARYNVPGATVAVVRDGRLVVAKGYGYRDIANKTPVDANTTSFRIGSVSKLFTWTAVMQQVEAGTIDLDADINTYLKDFKIPDTYPGKPVTMRHLMTHTAGFEDSWRNAGVDDVADLIPVRTYCAENIPARFIPPGTVSSYSNYGSALASVVVEDVTGIPFTEYVQSHIFTPLSMDQTSLQEDLPPDLASSLTKGYVYANGEENLPTYDYIFVIAPAGSISSTAPDMAKFLIAHLQNGTYRNATILSSGTASQMHARTFANDEKVPGMCLGFYEMQVNDIRAIGHGGDTKTFHSLIVLLPEKNAGFFVSYNSPTGSSARGEFFAEFMDHYYPQAPQSLPTPDPSLSAALQKYAGMYESNRHNYARFEKFSAMGSPVEFTVTPHGTLQTATGGIPMEYIEVSPGIFSRLDGTRPAGSGNLVFHSSADGTIDYLCIGNQPFFVFDRVPWYATPAFVGNVRNAGCILLATILLWPLLFAFRRTHAIPEPQVPKYAHAARWIAGFAAIILLVFVVVLLPAVMSDPVLVHTYQVDPTVPVLLTALLTLPVIAAILTVVTVAFAILAWKARYWTLPHRVHYTIITLALILILWWVHFNNLWVWCL